MLSSIGLRHPSAGYYLAEHREELPTSLGLRPEGWWGRQADALGLVGRASADEMEALCRGAIPAGPRFARREVLAYDLTFSAPKEASLLLVADDRTAGTLLAAHGAAVAAGLAYLEDRAASVLVGTPDGRAPSRVAGIAVHASTHASSRAGDPHLHTHCLLANAAQGPDGRFRALDGRGLRAHAMAADALYRSELAHQLWRRLEPVPRGLEPELGTQLRAAFSSRTAEVAAGDRRAAARGPEGRAEQLLRWRGRLATLGVQVGDGTLTAAALVRPRRRLDEHRFAAELLGDDRRRGRRDLVVAWAKAAGPLSAAGVLGGVDVLLGEGALGVGVAEEVVMPHAVLAPTRALRRLGGRPLEVDALEAWLRQARLIDRGRGGPSRLGPGRARA